jgi:predicted transposase
MKQTMRLKLVPTPDQHAALLETLHAFNAACTYAAEPAFAARTANQFERQKLVYGALRATYHLPAQLTIRPISKTVEAYQRDKDTQPPFRPEGAIVSDPRAMSFKGPKTVWLLTRCGARAGPVLGAGVPSAAEGGHPGAGGSPLPPRHVLPGRDAADARTAARHARWRDAGGGPGHREPGHRLTTSAVRRWNAPVSV